MRPILRAGDRVAVVAPSHAFVEAKLAEGLGWARDLGLELIETPHLREPHRRFAAPHAARLESLAHALTSEDFDAVWVVRGGSGLLQLLDRLPADLPARPVIGFSDVTALFCALDKRGVGPLVHGPVLHALPATDETSRHQLKGLLLDGSMPAWRGSSWQAGTAEGQLVGGNLTVLAAACGTPHQLCGKDRIILLEEIGELPYRVERCIQQLLSSGVFEGVAGVALGSFVDCHPPQGARWTLTDGLQELLLPLGVPVIADLPVGHGPTNHAFVWGTKARIEGDRLAFEA